MALLDELDYAGQSEDDLRESRQRNAGNRGTPAPTFSPAMPPVQSFNPGDTDPSQPNAGLVPQTPTVGAGGLSDQQQRYIDEAKKLGATDEWIANKLRTDPGDYHRLASSYASNNMNRPYDSQTSNVMQQQMNAASDAQRGFNPYASGSWNPAAGGGAQGASRTNFTYNAPGLQFDDPYTRALEDLVRQQLASIQQPQTNPALDSLTNFLTSRFAELSGSPGYSPDELALLRTQFQEPIEQDRRARHGEVLQRTAARGFLPSSGLHEGMLQDVDAAADARRMVAQRDLAVGAIDRRDSDLNQAMQVGNVLGVQIPGLQRSEDQQRRAEALQLASLLYDLPNRALQENMAVINGTSSPESLFNQSVQFANQQAQQRLATQQMWAQIGQLLAGLQF